MTKHTPGPWSVEHDYKPYVIRSRGDLVATITGTAAIRPSAAANARLIASAPDLLAALVIAEEILRINGFDDHAATARAALARAKGITP